MGSIGIIDTVRLRHIPARHHAAHELCFHLHDTMARLLVDMESSGSSKVAFSFSNEEEREMFKNSDDIFNFLENSGRTAVADRIILNQINIALFSDILHFIYESLICLEKRKFTVALALLRKPFKEGLILVAWMCADEDEFLEKLRTNPGRFFDQGEISSEKKLNIFESAKKNCEGSDFISAEQIYKLIYDRKNEDGLAKLFDKANHLVTRNPHIATEKLNINFIFKNPLDNDIYENFYSDIAKVLIFFNLLQIELYSRMGELRNNYKNWLLLTSIASYEGIFLEGKSAILRTINSSLKEFLKWPNCDAQLRVAKKDSARFFILETLLCSQCGMEHHFPVGWFLSKFKGSFS